MYIAGHDTRVFRPADLQLLSRVFKATSSAEESSQQREDRASRIFAYYMIGITEEAELQSLSRQPLGR
jgi:hypothetical protein